MDDSKPMKDKWFFSTESSTFTIERDSNSGKWMLAQNGDVLGNYELPQLASLDLKLQRAGEFIRPELKTLNIPPYLSQWKIRR